MNYFCFFMFAYQNLLSIDCEKAAFVLMWALYYFFQLLGFIFKIFELCKQKL